MGDRNRDPVRVGTLLRSLLAADAGGGDGPLDGRTVTDYLQPLQRLGGQVLHYRNDYGIEVDAIVLSSDTWNWAMDAGAPSTSSWVKARGNRLTPITPGQGNRCACIADQ